MSNGFQALKSEGRAVPSARPAAFAPHMPCAPAPGGVDAEHRYVPGTPCRTGRSRSVAGTAAAQRGRPADDVAADVVRVVGRHLGRWSAPRADEVAEPRSEAFELSLDRFGGVAGEPEGTWAYVQSGWTSPTDRVGSARYCWPTSTNGARASFRAAPAGSLATISACTAPEVDVPAPRAASAVQGKDPLGRVDLEGPGPVTVAAVGAEWFCPANWSPRMSTAIDGDTSSITRSHGGSWS